MVTAINLPICSTAGTNSLRMPDPLIQTTREVGRWGFVATSSTTINAKCVSITRTDPQVERRPHDASLRWNDLVLVSDIADRTSKLWNFICSTGNCDIWWKTDNKAAAADTEALAQQHRLPGCVYANACMKTEHFEFAVCCRRGNLLIPAELVSPLPTVIHAETAGCNSVFCNCARLHHCGALCPDRPYSDFQFRHPAEGSHQWYIEPCVLSTDSLTDSQTVPTAQIKLEEVPASAEGVVE